MNTIPKILLGCWPTPLQGLRTLGRMLGDGKRFFVKRDDLCGVGLGGNKVRKMEYFLAEALAQGCDCIITGGGSQSNQTIAAAACACKVGLSAHLVVPETTGPSPRQLGELLGVTFHFVEKADQVKRGIRQAEKELRAAGFHPFIISPGANTPKGILGYVDAMRELYSQAAEQDLMIDHVVCCGGTGNTYAGVVLGTKLFSPNTTATVISVARRFTHKETLHKMIRQAEVLLGCSSDLTMDDFHIHFCSGKGLNDATPKGKAAMEYMAQQEGIFLDPVYTGKAFVGLLEMNEQGLFQNGDSIVFLHSGGMLTLRNSFTK